MDRAYRLTQIIHSGRRIMGLSPLAVGLTMGGFRGFPHHVTQMRVSFPHKVLHEGTLVPMLDPGVSLYSGLGSKLQGIRS